MTRMPKPMPFTASTATVACNVFEALVKYFLHGDEARSTVLPKNEVSQSWIQLSLNTCRAAILREHQGSIVDIHPSEWTNSVPIRFLQILLSQLPPAPALHYNLIPNYPFISQVPLDNHLGLSPYAFMIYEWIRWFEQCTYDMYELFRHGILELCGVPSAEHVTSSLFDHYASLIQSVKLVFSTSPTASKDAKFGWIYETVWSTISTQLTKLKSNISMPNTGELNGGLFDTSDEVDDPKLRLTASEWCTLVTSRIIVALSHMRLHSSTFSTPLTTSLVTKEIYALATSIIKMGKEHSGLREMVRLLWEERKNW